MLIVVIRNFCKILILTYLVKNVLHFYLSFQGLTINDLEDLLADINIYVEIEDCKNSDYWKDITIIVEDELAKLRKIDPNAKGILTYLKSYLCNSNDEYNHYTNMVIVNNFYQLPLQIFSIYALWF